jgi:hypothetical protein
LWLDQETEENGNQVGFAFLELGKPSFLLCKLHGSVNFFHLDDRPGQPPLFVFSCELGGKGRGVGCSRVDEDDVPIILMKDAPSVLMAKYHRITPAIVPPTYAKLQGYDWLRAIWSTAFGAIQDARTLIFIGYSLPASDGFMRAMFQAALAARTHDEPPEVYVVDNCRETLDRYRDFFGGLNLDGNHLIKKPFEQAVDDGDFRRILENVRPSSSG